MMRRIAFAAVVQFVVAFSALAEVELPAVFSDHMVLQRGQPLPIWGRAPAGAEVAVTFGEQTSVTTAGADGSWRVTLAPLEASSAPAELRVAAGTSSRVVRDVLVGEVWLCSGQSNMEWAVQRTQDGDMESLAKHPGPIRLLRVDRIVSAEPLFSGSQTWQVAEPSSIASFSSVGWHFGKALQQALDVPVGLIDASWGGTPAIAWTRSEALERHPYLRQKRDEWERGMAAFPAASEAWKAELEQWLGSQPPMVEHHLDPGIDPAFAEAHLPMFDDRGWKPVPLLPAPLEILHGPVDGAFWFRTRVPAAEIGREGVKISLGRIDDYDQVWVNGVRVGGISEPADNAYTLPRVYEVPASAIHGDTLTLAVRVFDRFGGGGFTGRPEDLWIGTEHQRISLTRGWVSAAEKILEPAKGPRHPRRMPGAPPAPNFDPDSPFRPAGLANGMISPLIPFAMRGVIWYQGETDADADADSYDERLEVMVADWRAAWANPELYFGVVQLANFLSPKPVPSDDPWPHLREAQRRFVRRVPHTGLAVAIDVGEADDIHPRDKITVGRRLARLVLADVYRKLDLRGGPEVEDFVFHGSEVLLRFRQVGEGIKARHGGAPGGFTLAGADGVFHAAEAEVLAPDLLRVRAAAVPEPVHLRYGWQNNPVEANLINQARLPAAPFELRKE